MYMTTYFNLRWHYYFWSYIPTKLHPQMCPNSPASLVRGNRTESTGYDTFYGGTTSWLNTGNERFSPNIPVFSPTFFTFYPTTQCMQPEKPKPDPRPFLLGAVLGTPLITPYGEFNHFPKNVAQDRGAATSFLGEKLGNVTNSQTRSGKSRPSFIFPQPLPRSFPKEMAGWALFQQYRPIQWVHTFQ